jgi:tetratricopeptide (TPR) repeat protein
MLIAPMLSACSKPLAKMTSAELLDLGEKYLLEMNYEEAIPCFDRLIEVEPRNTRGYTGLAEAYVALGNEDGAIVILRQGMQHLLNNTEISTMLDELVQSNFAQGLTPELTPTPRITPTQTPESQEVSATLPDNYLDSYYEIVAKLIKKTGVKQDDINALGGVTLAMLMDFDDNGAKELICSYCEQDTDWPPIIEVYGHDGTNPVLITRMELGEASNQTDLQGYLYVTVVNGIKYIMCELPKNYENRQHENNCVLTVKGLAAESITFSASQSSSFPEIDDWYETDPLDRVDLFFINGIPADKDKYLSEYLIYNDIEAISFDICWGDPPHMVLPYALYADLSKYGCELIDLQQVRNTYLTID